jgi:hypothetical protein
MHRHIDIKDLFQGAFAHPENRTVHIPTKLYIYMLSQIT